MYSATFGLAGAPLEQPTLDSQPDLNQHQLQQQWEQATSSLQPDNQHQLQRQWEQAASFSQPLAVYNEDDGRYIRDEMEDFKYGEHKVASTSSMQNSTVLTGGAFVFSMLSAAADSLSGRDNENSRITSGSTLDTKVFPESSFIVKLPPTRHSETAMTINYPLALQEKILPLRSKLYPLLEKLGVDSGAGFSFGYDTLPEIFNLGDHDDHSIFTGSFHLVFC